MIIFWLCCCGNYNVFMCLNKFFFIMNRKYYFLNVICVYYFKKIFKNVLFLFLIFLLCLNYIFLKRYFKYV